MMFLQRSKNMICILAGMYNLASAANDGMYGIESVKDPNFFKINFTIKDDLCQRSQDDFNELIKYFGSKIDLKDNKNIEPCGPYKVGVRDVYAYIQWQCCAPLKLFKRSEICAIRYLTNRYFGSKSGVKEDSWGDAMGGNDRRRRRLARLRELYHD